MLCFQCCEAFMMVCVSSLVSFPGMLNVALCCRTSFVALFSCRLSLSLWIIIAVWKDSHHDIRDYISIISIYVTYRGPFILCSVFALCALRRAVAYELHLLRGVWWWGWWKALPAEEGTKDVWWTAVKWLSELCFCRVAFFSPSVTAFNELLISLLYI